VHRLYRAGLRHCFHPVAVVVQVLLAVAGAAAMIATLRSGSSVQLHVDAAVVPVVIGIGLVAVAVHELAHALVVAHHGRSIDSIGFRLHLGTPSFYVESVEALLLTRRQRLVQAAAGPWAEWLLTSAVAIAAWGVAPRGVTAVVLTRFVVLNAVTVLSNLLPFGGLDGSHLLADLVGVPDLQRRSRTAFGRVARSLARGGSVVREDLALCSYVVANVAVSAALVLFSAVLWVELFGGLVRSMWHAGPLGVAGLAAAAVLFGRPLLVAGAPGVLDAARTCAGVVHDVRFRRSVQWRRAAMLELHRMEPALRALDERALGIAAGLLTLVPGAAPQTAAAGQLVVPVAPMRGARRGGAAVLDLELLRRCEP
jgi:Zn-dependent protease